MKHTRPPLTIDQSKLPLPIFRRYQGEIDRFVNDVFSGRNESHALQLADVVRRDAYSAGQYIGYQGQVWHVLKVTHVNILTDPPIEGGDVIEIAKVEEGVIG